MIRFDTFIFDYDTKNVIVFSCEVVLLRVRHALNVKGFNRNPEKKIDYSSKKTHGLRLKLCFYDIFKCFFVRLVRIENVYDC